MIRIAQHFDSYSLHHTGRGNRVCHLIGLPSLGIALVGLSSAIPGPVDLGLALLALLAGVYVVLEWRLAILFALACPGIWLLARILPWQVEVMLLAIGLVVPIAGHVLYEKAGPASLREGAMGTLIAPLWFLNLFARVVPPERS